ncbi:MAG: iron-sulfur cluster-binding domain-containing protein [Ferruginibacter sp.]
MNESSSIIKRVKVVSIIRETSNAKTFVVAFLDDWNPAYKPGQFITIVFYTKHGERRRSYSISSAINEPFSFTVKKVDNGEFSRFLISHVKVGDILYSSGISGFFLLPGNIDEPQQYFFLAAGSGITPCFSMIKTILVESTAKVVLIYSNKNEADCIFHAQLQILAEKYKEKFVIHFLFSYILDEYRSRLSKWLLQQLLDAYLIVPANHALFYMCGPFEYMRMINITLLERIAANNIFKETFITLPRLIIPKPPDLEAHMVSISINSKMYLLKVQHPLSILATAKINKIELPYSCEAGRCGSCVATCTKGKIWMAYNEVLTDDEVGRGRVLLCQGYPVGGDADIIF